MKLYISILLFITIGVAQLSFPGSPLGVSPILKEEIETIEFFDVNLEQLLLEDENSPDLPYRFGYNIPVDIGTKHHGTWSHLENGDRVWHLKIYSQEAFSINLIYDFFHIPIGAKFFLYNEDYSQVLGAFTEENHKSHLGFSTSPIFDDTIILEYYEPHNANFPGEINISSIIHGYRNLLTRGYGDSEECNNNVNCDNGQQWTDEVNSVVMILTQGGTRICTGFLINNVRQDFTPYLITSQTCLGGHEDWIFMFNYESTNCENENGITSETLSGSTLLDMGAVSDYALLQISEFPPEYYDVYYAGWDARDITPSNLVTIHHPVGDIKKISFDADNAISDGWYTDDDTHWRVAEWDSGTTEPGSFGAPLYNGNKHIVGQLHGGESSCEENYNDYFGKFSASFDSGLNTWLDPDNTSTLVLDGLEVIESPDPELSIVHDPLYILINDNEMASIDISISNVGDNESILSYSIYNTPFEKPATSPDELNYFWTDSDIDDSEPYYWIDIDNSATTLWFENDDNAPPPVDIEFDFLFYDEYYNQCLINPNGWIGFGLDNSQWDNHEIPSNDAPKPAIFAFWDDLNPISNEMEDNMSGHVRYHSNPERLIIWYDDVVRWGHDDGPYNFQVVLFNDGRIDINYRYMQGIRNSSTTGIQNASGDIGLQVAFDENYVHNFLGLSFAQGPSWLSIEGGPLNGNLDYGQSITYNIIADGSQMNEGDYLTYINVESNSNADILLPIYVQVGFQSDSGDVNYDGEINVLDVVLLISIILGDHQPNLEADFNHDGIINVLDVVSLINFILNR